MGGVPVPVQTRGCLQTTVPHITVPLPTGLAHVVCCLPGELKQVGHDKIKTHLDTGSRSFGFCRVEPCSVHGYFESNSSLEVDLTSLKSRSESWTLLPRFH